MHAIHNPRVQLFATALSPVLGGDSSVEENARYLDSIGAFVFHPVDPKVVADAVRRALAAFPSRS